jgi:type IV pilus assembly protein PilX
MSQPRFLAARAQQGVILFIALIVLVAMSLAGIALMRSVDTNVLVAGNLAFRQSATSAGDWGVESARAYLQTQLSGNPASLDQDAPTSGYYSSWQSGVDLYNKTASTSDDFDWATGSLVGTDTGGNEVRYVVHRLCELAGPATSPTANCIKTATEGVGAGPAAGGTMGVVSYGTQQLPPATTIYYRITVRVMGPRNTRSFIQAVLK